MTTDGKKCVFPFKYNGKTYNKCTTVDNGNTEWCATEVKTDGNYKDWGNCDVSSCGKFNK